jgi:hypothetical protein
MSPCVPPPTKATSAISTAANRWSTRRRPKNNLQIAIETLRIKAYSAVAGLGPTSEMGPCRSGYTSAISGVHLKADMGTDGGLRRYGPIGDICRSSRCRSSSTCRVGRITQVADAGGAGHRPVKFTFCSDGQRKAQPRRRTWKARWWLCFRKQSEV